MKKAYYGGGMDGSGIDIEDPDACLGNDPHLPALIRIDHVGDRAILSISQNGMRSSGNTLLPAAERNEFWLAESSTGGISL